MYEITNILMNNGIFSFNLNGTGYQFFNSSLLNGHELNYKWRNPWEFQVRERYMIHGNGNYTVMREGLEYHIAYIILRRTNDNTYHVIKSADFWRDLIVDD